MHISKNDEPEHRPLSGRRGEPKVDRLRFPSRKLALAAVGTTALALLPGSSVAAAGGGDDTFQAAGRPDVTQAFLGPDGPTRFTDRVRIKIDLKIEGERTKVIKLHEPAGMATAIIELESGDSFPWHVHPGPVLVSVVGGGELSFMRADDCVVRPFAAGSAFLEPGPELHTAFNQGAETITLVGTFFDVAPGEALSTAASHDQQLSLDNKCGIHTLLP